jgi:hypothetical protein
MHANDLGEIIKIKIDQSMQSVQYISLIPIGKIPSGPSRFANLSK